MRAEFRSRPPTLRDIGNFHASARVENVLHEAMRMGALFGGLLEKIGGEARQPFGGEVGADGVVLDAGRQLHADLFVECREDLVGGFHGAHSTNIERN